MAGWQRVATLEIDWSGAPLGELMAHLVLVHHNRFRVEIPALQGLMQEVYAGYRQRDFARLARLPGLLFVLGNELEQHMRREELAIFPAIEALEKSVETGEEPASGIAVLQLSFPRRSRNMMTSSIASRKLAGSHVTTNAQVMPTSHIGTYFKGWTPWTTI